MKRYNNIFRATVMIPARMVQNAAPELAGDLHKALVAMTALENVVYNRVRKIQGVIFVAVFVEPVESGLSVKVNYTEEMNYQDALTKELQALVTEVVEAILTTPKDWVAP